METTNWKLKKRIIEKFFRQWRFAKALGVNESVVSKVVNGATDLPENKKLIWAKTFGCKVSDIF